MEIKFLGTGSAFCMSNFQSNAIIYENHKRMLIDVGSDIRFSLKEANLTVNDIDSIYLSHAHADHIGGLEYIAFSTYFNPNAHKINLYIHESWVEELWNESLKGGLKGIEGKKMFLDDYFNIIKIRDNEPFYWQNIEFYTVQTLHIFAQYTQIDSYGLMINYDENKKLYFTTDCQFAPETAQKAFYKEANIIFHDCETSEFKSGVHAHYNDLKTLSNEIKSKMYLYHYQDNVSNDLKTWQQKAIDDGFGGFISRKSVFNDRYGMKL